MSDGPVVFFDGVCNLCNGAVKWILAHERDQAIRFAPLQSASAESLLGPKAVEGIRHDPASASVVFVDEQGQLYTHSAAALQICGHLKAPWRWLFGLRVVPRSIRDGLYTYVARHRYRWFGKQEACVVPSPSVQNRFLD